MHWSRGQFAYASIIQAAKRASPRWRTSSIVDSNKKFVLGVGVVSIGLIWVRMARSSRGKAAAALPMSGGASPLDQITQMASKSRLARFAWRGRGRAPAGYIKGMALVYGRVYCKFKAGDAAVLDMAHKKTGDQTHDALTWYEKMFKAAGMDNGTSGVDTLRHLFVLLIGLGMRETSGRYYEGRDTTARNATADTAEAGLFQMSFNARTASPLLPRIFARYQANPSGFLDVFKEGVRPSAASLRANLRNFGSGKGKEFQRLCKECPAFAAEFAAVALRHIRKHWGPIIRKQAQIRPECDALLRKVQAAVDASPALRRALV
jgi:hypothetical protein